MTTRSISKSKTFHTLAKLVNFTPLPAHAECVEVSCRTIIEVLNLYYIDPNDMNLELLQEAVALTAQVHGDCLSMTTRSGMIYKPSIKKKHALAEPVIEEVEAPLNPLPPHAECVEETYHTIIEVLELYYTDPTDMNLELLQETVALTVQIHRTYCPAVSVADSYHS